MLMKPSPPRLYLANFLGSTTTSPQSVSEVSPESKEKSTCRNSTPWSGFTRNLFQKRAFTSRIVIPGSCSFLAKISVLVGIISKRKNRNNIVNIYSGVTRFFIKI